MFVCLYVCLCVCVRQDEEHKLIARYTSKLAEIDSTGVSKSHLVVAYVEIDELR